MSVRLDPAAWESLAASLADSAVDAGAWQSLLAGALEQVRHGDLPRWLDALDRLPAIEPIQDLDRPAPALGRLVDNDSALRETLMAFHPWRKGPLCLGGVTIDTEWRSDWKWARLRPHLELEGATVLDVGCGNGYFGWRMLGAGARCVVGIDPTVLFVAQWLVQSRFAGAAANYVLPLRDTDLDVRHGGFDAVFSLGVLYHRRDPLDHLRRLLAAAAPGGQLVLETLVVESSQTLLPAGRYARMRNVQEVPTVDRLIAQLRDAGFEAPRLRDLTRTTTDEQRSTDWMRFESLAQALDPDDASRTVEGHPAPQRAIVTARRPVP